MMIAYRLSIARTTKHAHYMNSGAVIAAERSEAVIAGVPVNDKQVQLIGRRLTKPVVNLSVLSPSHDNLDLNS